MASVRDTIYGMLTEYPSLFQNKADCYIHLFLVNGNGYDWIDGELVCWSAAKSKPDFKDEDAEVQIYRDKDEWDGYDYGWVRLNVRRNNARIQFAIDNFDLMMDESIMFYSTTRNIRYSGWDYCPLMQVPEDVKDDWKEAVLECMSNLHPFIYQTLPYCDDTKKSLEHLSADLKRLKEEKFPEQIKRDKEMAEFAKKLIDKLNDDE